MSKKLFQCGLVGFFLFALLAPSDARGRKPEDDDADNFPDYNRLEMRPKKNAHADETRALDTPPPSKPPLNAPADFPPEDETPSHRRRPCRCRMAPRSLPCRMTCWGLWCRQQPINKF